MDSSFLFLACFLVFFISFLFVLHSGIIPWLTLSIQFVICLSFQAVHSYFYFKNQNSNVHYLFMFLWMQYLLVSLMLTIQYILEYTECFEWSVSLLWYKLCLQLVASFQGAGIPQMHSDYLVCAHLWLKFPISQLANRKNETRWIKGICGVLWEDVTENPPEPQTRSCAPLSWVLRVSEYLPGEEMAKGWLIPGRENSVFKGPDGEEGNVLTKSRKSAWFSNWEQTLFVLRVSGIAER